MWASTTHQDALPTVFHRSSVGFHIGAWFGEEIQPTFLGYFSVDEEILVRKHSVYNHQDMDTYWLMEICGIVEENNF